MLFAYALSYVAVSRYAYRAWHRNCQVFTLVCFCCLQRRCRFVHFDSDMSLLGGVNVKCKVCTKTAYPQESIQYDQQTYHKRCFRCTKCEYGSLLLLLSSLHPLRNAADDCGVYASITLTLSPSALAPATAGTPSASALWL